MKKIVKISLSLFLSVAIIFGSAYVGLGELDFSKFFAVEAKATSESSLVFDLSYDRTYYSVKSCSTSASGEIIIPATYNGLPVKRIDANAFQNCGNITSISIPATISSMGYYSFYSCSGLEGVYITDVAAWCAIDFYHEFSNPLYYAKNLYVNNQLVTKLIIPDGVTNINNWAFRNCTSFTSIVIPDSVQRMGKGAFDRCSSLESAYITDLAAWCAIEFSEGVSNLLTYADNFYVNEKLITELVVPEGVTSISDYAFYNCLNFTSVSFPSSLVSIGKNVFYRCSFSTVEIPDGVKYIGDSAFSFCKTLESVDIADSVIEISDRAFLSCTSLTKVNIPANITSLAWGVFSDCTSLASITIPDNVTSISKYAFVGCSSLTSITIPDSVKSLDDFAFKNCTNLVSITIPDTLNYVGTATFENTAFYNDVNNWENDVLYIKKYLLKANSTLSGAYEIKDDTKIIAKNAFSNCKELLSVDIPDTVFSIESGAFQNCTGMTSFEIPDTVTEIGDTLFLGCTNLQSVTISRNVKSIGMYNFCNCSKLKTITIPDNITDIGEWAFRNCTGLETVVIGNGVKSIGESAFGYCRNLSSVTIGNGLMKVDANAFEYCSNLSGVYITDLASWCAVEFTDGDSNPVVYSGKLYINGKLATDLVIPQGVTCINRYVFGACKSLTSVTIPDSVTSIGSFAFSSCDNLSFVSIPSSVKTIEQYAFASCLGLGSVLIPDGVARIAPYAFYNSSNLESVTIAKSVEYIGPDAFNKFEGIMYCAKDSEAHEYAVDYNIKYSVLGISEKEGTAIDEENFTITTSVQNISDITEILGLSAIAEINITPSYKKGDVEYLGTGTIISVFDGDEYIGDFVLVVEGDTDGDSVCDVIDCAMVERVSNGNTTLTGAYNLAANSNADDVIDVNDYQNIINKAIA